MSTEHETLTIEEALKYLQIDKRSVYNFAKAGEIPCRRI